MLRSAGRRVRKTFGEAQAIWEDKCWVLGDGSPTYGGNVGLTRALKASTSYISAHRLGLVVLRRR